MTLFSNFIPKINAFGNQENIPKCEDLKFLCPYEQGEIMFCLKSLYW